MPSAASNHTVVIGKGSGNACNVGRSKGSSPSIVLEVTLIILNGSSVVEDHLSGVALLHELGTMQTAPL